MLQNPRTTKSQFFGKIKIKKGPNTAIIQKFKNIKRFS
jgi:hypothetical protein